MSGNPRTANGAARRAVRAWLKSQGRPCHLCGRAIDYSLPAGDPWSFEVDEIVPVSKGGSPVDRSNVAPAHRICNQRRGNRPLRKGPPKRGYAGVTSDGRQCCGWPLVEGVPDAPHVVAASEGDIEAAIEDARGSGLLGLGTEDPSPF